MTKRTNANKPAPKIKRRHAGAGPKRNPSAKRTDAQIDRDREFVSQKRCEGLTYRAITQLINDDPDRPYTLKHVQIHQDHIYVLRASMAARQEYADTYIEYELASIEAVESQAWEQWQKSKLTHTVKTVKSGKEDSETTRTEGRIGDPKFLDTVLRCGERRARLLGIDAPIKVDGTGFTLTAPALPATINFIIADDAKNLWKTATVQQQ